MTTFSAASGPEFGASDSVDPLNCVSWHVTNAFNVQASGVDGIVRTYDTRSAYIVWLRSKLG